MKVNYFISNIKPFNNYLNYVGRLVCKRPRAVKLQGNFLLSRSIIIHLITMMCNDHMNNIFKKTFVLLLENMSYFKIKMILVNIVYH